MRFHLKQSLLAAVAFSFCLAASAQNAKSDIPKGWHLMDLQQDGYYGISLNKAYDFVKNKKSKQVIVAVIDSGVDTTHEDLKPILWTNPKEIPGNGVDDDHNGYVDDIHGWNFLGGKDGRNVNEDSYEAARVYHHYKERFEKVADPSTLSKEDQDLYQMWQKAEKQVVGDGKTNGLELMVLHRTYNAMLNSDTVLRKAIGKESFTGKDLEAFNPTTEEQKKAKATFLYFFTTNNIMDVTNASFLGEFKEYLDGEEKKAEAADKAPEDYRGEIVKDNYYDFNDRYYGNNDVMAGTPLHGTHVTGIIGAVRNNGIGVNGIADNVKVMMIRAVPDGDEHDKDIALAIRYAVDNGAKVVNMSFGKGFSPEKTWVDEAVKYAESKGVLLVHAAGNDAADVDTTDNFPNPHFKNSDITAPNWITVGASGDPKGGGLVAYFSNYGKKDVDVFAPGVKIYSTVPTKNEYRNEDGTSMASPVVAGVAAFVLSYYPTLTPEQLKYVIENSAVKPQVDIKAPGDSDTKVKLSAISKTGGIVNAYEAVKLADTLTKGKTVPASKSKKSSKAFVQ